MKSINGKNGETNKTPGFKKAVDGENDPKSATMGAIGLLAGGAIGGAIGTYFFQYPENAEIAMVCGCIGYFVGSGGDLSIFKYFFK